VTIAALVIAIVAAVTGITSAAYARAQAKAAQSQAASARVAAEAAQSQAEQAIRQNSVLLSVSLIYGMFEGELAVYVRAENSGGKPVTVNDWGFAFPLLADGTPEMLWMRQFPNSTPPPAKPLGTGHWGVKVTDLLSKLETHNTTKVKGAISPEDEAVVFSKPIDLAEAPSPDDLLPVVDTP